VIEEALHEICRMRFGCQPEQRLRVREVRCIVVHIVIAARICPNPA
jgi:hypothetical protein